MCILAHPDDESLGTGGILARYAAEGLGKYLVTATRGEYGWMGEASEDPGPQALGQIREAELNAAAKSLGLREVHFLDYVDGLLDQADFREAVAKIVLHLRRIRPQVVVTFGPDGAYGHPDHIAISQLTMAACLAAGDPSYQGADNVGTHNVSKLYYMAETQELLKVYVAVFGEMAMHVDGTKRGPAPWPPWAYTARIDTSAYQDTVWQAVACHRSQLPAYSKLAHVTETQHDILWGSRTYYRAYSLLNGGRKVERDLFEWLRP